MTRPPPELVLKAIAASEDRHAWERELRKVRQMKLQGPPQTSVSLIQPAVARALNRNASFPTKSSDELLNEFARRTNAYLGGNAVLKGRAEAMTLIVRLGCVLLRMQKLDQSPALSKMLVDTACLGGVLNFQKSVAQMNEGNLRAIAKRLMNARASPRSGVLLDTVILEQIHDVFRETPRSGLEAVRTLAEGVLSHILNIYGQEYKSLTSTSMPRRIPVEFFMLIGDSDAMFEKSAFALVTKNVLKMNRNKNLTTIDVEAMPEMVFDADKKLPHVKAYSSMLAHAQTLIRFYKKKRSLSAGDRNTMSVLRKLYRVLSTFQARLPPGSADVLSDKTFEMSRPLEESRSSLENTKTDYVKALVRQQAEFERYLRTSKEKPNSGPIKPSPRRGNAVDKQ